MQLAATLQNAPGLRHYPTHEILELPIGPALQGALVIVNHQIEGVAQRSADNVAEGAFVPAVERAAGDEVGLDGIAIHLDELELQDGADFGDPVIAGQRPAASVTRTRPISPGRHGLPSASTTSTTTVSTTTWYCRQSGHWIAMMPTSWAE